MSEYWKSTPKYYCKQCKTYVRDTKFERNQHEATAKHQGNLKRSLRDLHRDHEREERETQRAKNEVERLNKVVSKASVGSVQAASTPLGKPAIATTQPVSIGESKRRLAQLADMGVAIPEEYRGEMAMAGDWRTVSERVLGANDGDYGDQKPGTVLSVGVRKRKFEGQEEEEETGESVVKRGWGSTIRSYPGSKVEDDELDALLSGTKVANPIVKDDPEAAGAEAEESLVRKASPVEEKKGGLPDIKSEVLEQSIESAPSADPLQENDSTPVVFFKKRKSKTATGK